MNPLLVGDLVVVGASIVLAWIEGRRGNWRWQRLWLMFAVGGLVLAATIVFKPGWARLV